MENNNEAIEMVSKEIGNKKGLIGLIIAGIIGVIGGLFFWRRKKAKHQEAIDAEVEKKYNDSKKEHEKESKQK